MTQRNYGRRCYPFAVVTAVVLLTSALTSSLGVLASTGQAAADTASFATTCNIVGNLNYFPMRVTGGVSPSPIAAGGRFSLVGLSLHMTLDAATAMSLSGYPVSGSFETTLSAIGASPASQSVTFTVPPTVDPDHGTPIPWTMIGTASDGSYVSDSSGASVTSVSLGTSGIFNIAFPGSSFPPSGCSQPSEVIASSLITPPSVPGTTPPSPTPSPTHGPTTGIASTPDGNGIWLTDVQGDVTAKGDARNFGSLSGVSLNAPISHIVSTPDGRGYWLVAADGGTFAFGNAGFFGSMGGQHLNAPVVDLAPTADGGGYWLVASDGGIFAFGDASFHGSMGSHLLNRPVVGIAPDLATGGYWEVATDGGIFAFSAPFFGSTGAMSLNLPVNGMAPTPDSNGYWFVASDGGIFAFGDAAFRGSTGGIVLSAPVVGMATDSATAGYWLVAADGRVFAYDAPTF